MKPSFDVLQEPWIPVVTFEGETLEVGILDALLRSPEWKEIQDPSPMVEYSVYRFLIVFLMDALRPETPVDLEELLYAGQFDESAIQDYITLCHSEGVSFDLFDPDRPFMQTSVDKNWDKQRKPVTTLDYTVPNGNNHIHFDHRRKHEVYDPGKAMRMLLTAQIFCTSAAQGYPSNVNGAPPWFSLVQGGNLFETLVRNMVYRDQIKVPFDDPPVFWRNTAVVESKKAVAQTSWLYGMLFPARRIHLLPREDGTVAELYFSQGMNYLDPANWRDPHVTYWLTQERRSNWKPKTEVAVWQNLANLIDTEHQCTPQVLSNYKSSDSEAMVVLQLYGVATNQASYLQSEKCALRLPLGIVGNDVAEGFVQSFIDTAKLLATTVYRALKHKEIPEVCRKQGVQRFYAASEQSLFQGLDLLCDSRADPMKLLQETEDKLLARAAACISEELNSLRLRGRAMLETAEAQQKEWNKARKTIKRKWNHE